MARVAVSQRVLAWAVNRSGLTLEQLRARLPKVSEWLAGTSQPTLRQLESLARATRTPLGFFFLESPPEERLPIPHFRTLRDEAPSRPSPDLLATVHMMERRQAWMREYLISEGHKPLPFVGSARVGERPAAVAQRMLRTLGFDEGWSAREPSWRSAVDALREAMEDAGILVVFNSIVGNDTHRKLDPREFRGFVLVDEYAPLVFVNSADAKAAQMFTLAHELAHVFFGISAAFDLRLLQPAEHPPEKACNQVAAEFLVPEHELRAIWPSVRTDPNPFQTVARQFKVSELVAARRALDLGLITQSTFLAFYRDYLRNQYRTTDRSEGGGDFYVIQNLRLGRRFAAAVARAAREGSLLYSEAYALTGLYGRTFDRYTDSLLLSGV